jgi:two-component system, sensor histidine kinase and response regulator
MIEKIKILVVDDEFGIRSGIKRILSKFEVDYPFMDDSITFDVIEAETGEIAIDLLEKESFGIVLLDNKLPGIQGVEVLEYINANNIKCSVVMITSYASLDLAVKATKEGAIDFVPKPFTPQELKASVENITKQIFLKQMAANLHREGRQIKFRFLSMLSHELKQPVDEVEGCLRKIKEREMGDNVRDYLPMLEKSSERLKSMRAMINDLMALTKTINPEKVKSIDMVDVSETATQVMHSIALDPENQGNKLYLVKKSGAFVKIDPNDLEIVFRNIFSHFLKNTKRDDSIACTIIAQNEKIKIVFSNDETIDEEFRIPVNDYSTEDRNKNHNKIPGTELGLSLVYKILEDYNAKISNENNDEKMKTEVVFEILNSKS